MNEAAEMGIHARMQLYIYLIAQHSERGGVCCNTERAAHFRNVKMPRRKGAAPKRAPLLQSNGRLDLSVSKLPTDNLTLSKLSKYADKHILPNSAGPSRAIFNGPGGSGKTNFCITLLTDPRFMLGFFDHIFVYCPSAGMQTDYDHLTKAYPPDMLEIKDFSPEEVKKDWEMTKKITEICKKKEWPLPQTLMLFDDLILTPGFDTATSMLNTKARHDAISVWVISQGLMSLRRLMRLQASHIFAFSPTESEIERLANECTNALCGADTVRQMILQATKERFLPFYCNRHAPTHLQYRQGLTNFFEVHDPGAQ